MPRVTRLLLPVAFAVAMLAGCGGDNPYDAAKNAPAASTADSGLVGDNEFLPDRDIGDCVGTLERPDCGSPEKGTKGTYLTFAVLIAGLGFIFWRISVSVRRRDAVVNARVVNESIANESVANAPTDTSTSKPE